MIVSNRGFFLFFLIIVTLLILFPPIVGIVACLAGLIVLTKIANGEESKQPKRLGDVEWRQSRVRRVVAKRWKHSLLLLGIILAVGLYEIPDIPIWTPTVGHDRFLVNSQYGRWGGGIGDPFQVKRISFLQNLLSVSIRFNSTDIIPRVAIWSTDGINTNNDVNYVNFQEILSNTTYHLPIEKSTTYIVEVSYSPNNVMTGITNTTAIDIIVTATYTLTWGDILR